MKKKNSNLFDNANKGDMALFKLLIRLGLIEIKEIPSDYSYSNRGLIHFLAGAGHLDEIKVIKAVAKELNISSEVMNPEMYPALAELLELDPLRRMNISEWRNFCALPLDFINGKIVLAVTNPLDNDLKSQIEFLFGCPVSLVITREQDIDGFFKFIHSGSHSSEIDSIVRDSDISKLALETAHPFQAGSSSVDDNPTEAPVIRLVNKVFHYAVSYGASDIHFTPAKDYFTIKIRVDGILRQLARIPMTFHARISSRIKFLGGMDLSERRKAQDGRTRINTQFGSRDLRISTIPAIFGENLVIRILSQELSDFRFKSLGMSEKLKNKYDNHLRTGSKIHLVTGPTGSGKTSTLYAALLELHDGKSNIITIEDPIELRIEGITQVPANSQAKLTFSEGLRSILRQDPDVILIGEIRDEPTAKISMQAAQTGHTVLSTLHTMSAPAAITRLRDIGVPSYLIASSIGTIMAQRLMRRLCSHCTEVADDALIKRAKDCGIESDNLRKSVGCSRCNNLGYKGRLGVFSMLEVSENIAEVIRSNGTEKEIAHCARKNGYRSLRESALELVEEGKTTLDELERVFGISDDTAEFELSDISQSLYPKQKPIEQARKSNGSPVKKKILLVEDDEDLRELYKQILESACYDVQVSEDGAQALKSLYESVPELIISDVMMPQMDGQQFLQRLKQDESLRHIPVLMLTANGSDKQELSLMSCGADDFVTKGKSPEIILARVRRLLNQSQSLVSADELLYDA